MNTKIRMVIKILAIAIGLIAVLSAFYFYFRDIKTITKDAVSMKNGVMTDSVEYEIVDSTGTNITKKNKREQWLITESSVGNIVSLGDDAYGVIRRLKDEYNVIEIEDGPDDGDVMYVVKDGDKPIFTIKRNSTGYVNDIIIQDRRFYTKSGANVGTPFTVLFNKFPNADMRFGDVVDGVNNINSGEMFKADGVLFVHLVPENSPRALASYNYDSMTFKIKNWNSTERVNEIIVSNSIW